MTPHRAIDHWLRENPRKVDLITGLAAWLLFGIGPVVLAGFGHGPIELLCVSLQLLPLIWRRTHPGRSAAVVILGCLLQVAFVPTFLGSQVAVLITVYGLAKYGRRWQSMAGLAAGLIGAMLATLRYAAPVISLTVQAVVLNFIGLGLLVLVSWTFGDLARTRRLAVRALEDRATRLEVERQQERELAASDERGRIAREMHDIVAHSLSVIITQSDGARYASEKDPEIARETLATISETGRKSLREMRRLLGVLRGDEQASTRPLPTLEDIPELLEATRTAGLDVSYEVQGTPRRDLPPGAELTGYRAVQEALTNTIKHAGPAARADVRLLWTSSGLELEVTDDGRGAGATEDNVGAQQGLVGMAERVALYDGRISTGPRPHGGFSASIFIPYTED